MTKWLTLLGHRMTRLFPLLLFIGLTWEQDFKVELLNERNYPWKSIETKTLWSLVQLIKISNS